MTTKDKTVQTTITLRVSHVIHMDETVALREVDNPKYNRSTYISGLIRKDMGLPEDLEDEADPAEDETPITTG